MGYFRSEPVDAAPVEDYTISPHAAFQLARRGIPLLLVQSVLRKPEQRWAERPGRHVLQSRMSGASGAVTLVRVFVDVEAIPPLVVTAYRTSKVAKYWRKTV